jgi:hypothetical protein
MGTAGRARFVISSGYVSIAQANAKQKEDSRGTVKAFGLQSNGQGISLISSDSLSGISSRILSLGSRLPPETVSVYRRAKTR